MTIVKIKDNGSSPKELFESIPNIVNAVLDNDMTDLEREGIFVFPELFKDLEGLSKEQKVLSSEKDIYRSSNVMGFIGSGKEKLIIESRFSRGETDFFFQYLLEHVLDLPHIVDLDSNLNKNSSIIDLYIFLFPYYLKKAMRKGIYKIYVRNEYNDNNVKGTIDINRHIKMNTPFLGNISYSQREFSYENYVVQLIRHTIEFIKRKKIGYSLLGTVADEVNEVNRSTPNFNQLDKMRVIKENIEKPIQHAYFNEYRELQRLCIMILQYEKHQIGSGIDRIHGILFDGAWLWEEYMDLLIAPYFYHPKNKGGKGAQRLFGRESGRDIGLIYPDFIGIDGEKKTIADAKYKPIQNIGNKDYLQLLAYMFRFDSEIGYYLYPDSEENLKLELYLNEGHTYNNSVKVRDDIKVVKHGLLIPLGDSNYKAFSKKMIESEKQFLKEFEDLFI